MTSEFIAKGEHESTIKEMKLTSFVRTTDLEHQTPSQRRTNRRRSSVSKFKYQTNQRCNPNPNRIAAATASYSRGGMLDFKLSMELQRAHQGIASPVTPISWMHIICNHSPLHRSKNNLFYPFHANQRV